MEKSTQSPFRGPKPVSWIGHRLVQSIHAPTRERARGGKEPGVRGDHSRAPEVPEERIALKEGLGDRLKMDLHQQVRLAASVVSRQATGGRKHFHRAPPHMVVQACVLTTSFDF